MPSLTPFFLLAALLAVSGVRAQAPGISVDGDGERARLALALSLLNSDAVALWAEEGDQRAAKRELVLRIQADSTGQVQRAAVVAADEAGAETRAALEQFVLTLQNAAFVDLDDEVTLALDFPDRRPPSPWVTGLVVGATLLGTLILMETLR